ncbi:MAG: FHA domain-containing protein [Cyanobacteria bacterium P01_G01_bin.39]
MITCPSCNHQNPEGSLQCENCYTPLPATTSCPNCGASVQTDATFCGQCGFNLQAENTPVSAAPIEETAIGSMPNMSLEEISLPDEVALSGGGSDMLPETAMSLPIQSPWDDNDDPETIAQTQKIVSGADSTEPTEAFDLGSQAPETDFIEPDFTESEPSPVNEVTMPWQADAPELDQQPEEEPVELSTPSEIEEVVTKSNESDFTPEQPTSSLATDANMAALGTMSGATQLQIQTASLLHLQSNTTIEISSNLDVVHIGKPNGQIPPDIDVAGFPDSEVVSRVHADIRIEGDAYFIEDVGSSNGTYVNHAPLLQGNRHRLRAGDRIALGKGDLVTFIFQLNQFT